MSPDSVYPRFVPQGLQLSNAATSIIEHDIGRTGCPEAFQEPVRRLLRAVAAKNSQFGLTQSMNFVTAALLAEADEQDASMMQTQGFPGPNKSFEFCSMRVGGTASR